MKLVDWHQKPHKDNYNDESSPLYEISQQFFENIQFHWIRLQAAPTRDYFQSAAASIFFSLIMKFRTNKDTFNSLKAILLRGIYDP